MKLVIGRQMQASIHGLRTANEGINQRNQKIWADVADKICRMGVDFWPCSEGDFHTGCS